MRAPGETGLQKCSVLRPWVYSTARQERGRRVAGESPARSIGNASLATQTVGMATEPTIGSGDNARKDGLANIRVVTMVETRS